MPIDQSSKEKLMTDASIKLVETKARKALQLLDALESSPDTVQGAVLLLLGRKENFLAEKTRRTRRRKVKRKTAKRKP